MSEITIKLGTEKDIDTIVSFNKAMAYETEKYVLPDEKIYPGVKNLLENDNPGFYLIAELKGQTVGSLMVTTEWSDWRNGLFWWVQSVYVKPEYRRMGIYSALYKHIKQLAAKSDSICGFRLYVEKNNTNAQKTYEKLGMTETHYRLFEETI